MGASIRLDHDSGSDSIREPLRLQASVESVAKIPRPLAEAMYALFARHYAETSWSQFLEDLSAKTNAVLLHDRRGRLCGFSTLELYQIRFQGRSVRVIYSGDTIVDPLQWGSSALAMEWLRFAGSHYARSPATPLFWLLIVKGHRTYRFLSTFAYHYLPHHDRAASPDDHLLRDVLAERKFGKNFDQGSGVVAFDLPRGRLADALADVPDRHRRLPAVAYFLRRNPGYHRGDELVCLCKLEPENLKPLARRAFNMHSNEPSPDQRASRTPD